jgi:D-alanyl-D-alanine carboxypeptidase/D-alanyl-D-alanine-endopeptidase (penicillin-binding protein 4)
MNVGTSTRRLFSLVIPALLAGCARASAPSGDVGPIPNVPPIDVESAVISPRILTETLAPPPPSAPLISPTAAARARLAQLVDSVVADPMFRSAHWGVLVVDATSGDTLISRNAGKLFLPASNTKLITGAVALAQLGADYRYQTRIVGASPQRGTVTGDLVVIGSGDPSFSDSLSGDALIPLRAMAESLWARGVRRVTGRLINGADVFTDSTLGSGWAWDDLDEEYSAPIDELMFNEGFAQVIIHGGARMGQPVRVRTEPHAAIPRIADVEVATVQSCCMMRNRVRAHGSLRGPRPTITLRGSVRAGDSVVVDVSLRHPNAAFLDALHAMLTERGISVARGVEADALGDTIGLVTLASRRSPPMSMILPAFEKPSQNQIGEILLKTLGLERAGAGTADSGLAVIQRQLAAWGVDSSQAVLRDGSGLSRHNFIAPEAIVRVLDAMRRRDDFAVYYQSLPVGGTDGTLRDRLRAGLALGNVRGKTGTLDKARSMSGYLTTADGQMLLFSIMVNNHTVPTRLVDRAQDLIVETLAGLDLSSP